MSKLLFVYGSLKRGFYNNWRLRQNRRFMVDAVIFGYRLYKLGMYPAITETCNKEKKVCGEIYAVDDEIVEEIDYIEKSAGFVQATVLAHLPDGQTQCCLTYVKHHIPLDAKEIRTGVWTMRHQNG